MAKLFVLAILMLGHVGAFGDDEQEPTGPAATRGWIVVVRGPGGGMSGSATDELPDEYDMHAVRDDSGLEVWVFDNIRLTVTGYDADEWSVVASRYYQSTGFLATYLFFLDPPDPEPADNVVFDMLLAYKSFVFGQQTHVIFCPPRADVTWEGAPSLEPITEGVCLEDATLTITLDDRTPILLSADSLMVEKGMGRILVEQDM